MRAFNIWFPNMVSANRGWVERVGNLNLGQVNFSTSAYDDVRQRCARVCTLSPSGVYPRMMVRESPMSWYTIVDCGVLAVCVASCPRRWFFVATIRGHQHAHDRR